MTADLYQAIADVYGALLDGGQSPGIRCRAAISVLERNGFTVTGYGPTADAIRAEVDADNAKSAEIERLKRELADAGSEASRAESTLCELIDGITVLAGELERAAGDNEAKAAGIGPGPSVDRCLLRQTAAVRLNAAAALRKLTP